MDLSIKQKENETELRAFGRGALTVIVYSGDGADRESLSTVLLPAGVAEAAGWLLGWLAEHAPEERAKLLDGLHGPIAALDAVGAPEGAPPDRVRALLTTANAGLAARCVAAEAERDKLANDLGNIADAVGLGGTRTRWEGQLLGKVENLIADVSDLRAANRALMDELVERRAEGERHYLELGAARREADQCLDFVADAVAQALRSGGKVAVTWPEVTRG